MTTANKFSKTLALLALAEAIVSMTGCYKVVEPGRVGIRIEQTDSQRGVQDFPISTGRVFYNPFNEEVMIFDTSVQQYTWTHDTNEGHPINEEMCFKSSEYLLFCADVNAAFRIPENEAPKFYVKFRNDDMDGFVHGFFRNIIWTDSDKEQFKKEKAETAA